MTVEAATSTANEGADGGVATHARSLVGSTPVRERTLGDKRGAQAWLATTARFCAF